MVFLVFYILFMTELVFHLSFYSNKCSLNKSFNLLLMVRKI